MEVDPRYKQMVKQSHILKKYNNLQMPLVPKQPTIKHHTLVTLTLSTCIHFLIYPFDTIKTRIISKNKFLDIARFDQNRVSELTTYKGLMRGYGAIMIGNLCHLALGKESLLLAASAEGILKTWVDMSKISKQMGNQKGDFNIMKKSFGICAMYGVLRDITFRTLYVNISSFLHKKYLSNSKFYDQRIKVNNIFFSVIAATVVSQPLEVCFIKTASQRSLKYTNFFKIPFDIIKDEGFGKIMFGGLWPRLIYNILSTMILLNTYEPCINATLQVM